MQMRPVQRLQPPSEERWFGSDHFGRDVYSRTIYGTRISLSVGVAVSVVSLTLGTGLGLVIGFYRRLDTVVMRVMDGLMAIPAILLALALMALMRGSVRNVIVALVIPEIPRVTRLVRASVLSLREHMMVEAARALGVGTPRILLRYILPGLVAPLIVQATYIGASAILFEAVSLVSRRRHAAAHSLVGQHHGGREDLRAAGVLDHPLPRDSSWPSPCWPSTSSATACATCSTCGAEPGRAFSALSRRAGSFPPRTSPAARSRRGSR